MWSIRPMSLPEAAEIETLPIGDLRSLVASLLAEVVRLGEENAALKDEIARLKHLPPRPKLKPSGMERASDPSASPGKGPRRRRGRRGAKRNRLSGLEDQVLTVAVPAGSRFKGYEDFVVQDLLLMPRVIRSAASAGGPRTGRRSLPPCRPGSKAGSARPCAGSCSPAMPRAR
jgi:hypothetical protein